MIQVVLINAGENDVLNQYLQQVFWTTEHNKNTNYNYYNLYDNDDNYIGWTYAKNCVPYIVELKELTTKEKIRRIRCL